MKNFVFIYYNDGDMSDMPREKVAAAWGAWFGQLGDKLVDGGNPFNEGGKAVTKDGISGVADSPATGYSIVKADDLAAATELAKSCPILEHSDSSSVQVYEALPM